MKLTYSQLREDSLAAARIIRAPFPMKAQAEWMDRLRLMSAGLGLTPGLLSDETQSLADTTTSLEPRYHETPWADAFMRALVKALISDVVAQALLDIESDMAMRQVPFGSYDWR